MCSSESRALALEEVRFSVCGMPEDEGKWSA